MLYGETTTCEQHTCEQVRIGARLHTRPARTDPGGEGEGEGEGA